MDLPVSSTSFFSLRLDDAWLLCWGGDGAVEGAGGARCPVGSIHGKHVVAVFNIDTTYNYNSDYYSYSTSTVARKLERGSSSKHTCQQTVADLYMVDVYRYYDIDE